MKKFILLLLILLVTFSASAVKLNQRGEKMVSEIRVTYPTESQSPYTIKFGYDDKGVINSLVFERLTVDYEIIRIQRSKDGKITRKNFANNKKISQYEIKIDFQKRPVEMSRYDIENKKPLKICTFYFDYNFQDYALSIVHRDAGDEPDLRESVKMIDNNAYIFYNVINPTNGKESKHTARDKNVSYSSYDNDLNVDILQIIRGYCNVGGYFLNLGVDSNLFILTQWIPIKSQKMLSTIQLEKMKYNFNGDILESVDVLYSRTNELNYTISLSYLE